MTDHGKTKILHQHLIKCGGTSLNAFFDTKFPVDRAHDARSVRCWREAAETRYGNMNVLQDVLARHRFRLYDCVHGHNPMAYAAPSDFLTVTVLRDPVERVLSQIRDWWRLHEGDLGRPNPANDDFIRFCWNNGFAEILRHWNDAPISRNNLKNMQNRLLALAFKGPGTDPVDDDERFDRAMRHLELFDVVGTTDDVDAFTVEVCRRMGWCPPRSVRRLNTTKDGGIDDETSELAENLNRHDRALYEKARELAGRRAEGGYDTDVFEAVHASQRTSVLPPRFEGDRSFGFDFNMPIVGNGLHGRDAPGSADCAVWTGPQTRTTLFVPVVPYTSMTVRLRIREYAARHIREGLHVRADGEAKTHEFVAARGCAEALEFVHVPTRDFIRLDIDAPRTVSTRADARERGVLLSGFGYTLEPGV